MTSLNTFSANFNNLLIRSLVISFVMCLLGLSLFVLSVVYDKKTSTKSNKKTILFKKVLIIFLVVLMLYLYFFPFIFSLLYLFKELPSFMSLHSINSILKAFKLKVYLIFVALVSTTIVYFLTDYALDDNLQFEDLT